jgi:hypothetical protein
MKKEIKSLGMMDSSISRARAGYTMVPKDDTVIDTSAPYDEPNGEEDPRRDEALEEDSLKGRKVLHRDRCGLPCL